LREGVEGLPATTDHQVIKYALLLPSQSSQFLWQRERQQKIRCGHLFIELPIQPLLGLMMLAMGAIAMAAGMRNEDVFFAVVALRQHHWTMRGAALF
jgi:hypothetical protein